MLEINAAWISPIKLLKRRMLNNEQIVNCKKFCKSRYILWHMSFYCYFLHSLGVYTVGNISRLAKLAVCYLLCTKILKQKNPPMSPIACDAA